MSGELFLDFEVYVMFRLSVECQNLTVISRVKFNKQLTLSHFLST
jgi:hypothetical protein